MFRKYTKAAAIIAAATLALSSCSNGGGENSEKDDNGKVTLTIADWQWLEPGRGDRLWEAMKEYEKVNENVTLKKKSTTRADYEKTMQTEIGGGGGPDVLVLSPSLLVQLQSASLLVPLEGVEDDGHVEEETFDGERLAYGWERVSTAFFYNKKLMAESGAQPPTDMDGVLDTAKAITEKTGNPGFAVRHSTSELKPWWTDFQNWIYGYGGSWVKDGELNIDDPKNVEAVAMLKKLYDSGSMPIGDDASTFRSRFANGQIGMMFDNPSVLFTILNDSDTLASDDVGVTLLPLPTDNSSTVANYIGINENSEHQEAAMGFMKWLSSDEGQKASARGIFPTLNATAAAPPEKIVKENPWISVYQKQAKTAKGSPVIPGFELQTPKISKTIMTAVESVLAADVDPETALKQAQEQAQGGSK